MATFNLYCDEIRHASDPYDKYSVIGALQCPREEIVYSVTMVPPLPEQHCKITQVDELMLLCDTLKTNLQNAQTTQLALADALVERAVN